MPFIVAAIGITEVVGSPPGYFRKVIKYHAYGSDACRLFLARRSQEILGYAITNPVTERRGGHCVYDLAASTPSAARKLLNMFPVTV